MNSFAFLTHPLDNKQIKAFWPITRVLPDFLIRPFLKIIHPSFKIIKINEFDSGPYRKTNGFLIVSTLLTRDLQAMDDREILDNVTRAALVAERLGAGIMGVNSGFSDSVNRFPNIFKKTRIAITTGNALNAWAIFEAVYRSAKSQKIIMKEANLLVIGASGNIGSICAKKFSEFVSKITLFDKNSAKLDRLKEEIAQMNNITVNLEKDLSRAAKEADIIIITETFSQPLNDLKQFKPKAIICDLALCRDLSHMNFSRDNIFINAGLIKLPFKNRMPLISGLPEDIVTAAMAEAMLLASEKMFVSYSLGEKVNPDKIEEIADLSAKHSFEVWVPEAEPL